VASPIALAFVCKDNEYIQKNKFFSSAQNSLIIMLIFGTICFYTKPGFYLNYLEITSLASLDNVTNWAGAGRLCTLVGSIETGQLACFLLIISWYFLINKERRIVSLFGILTGLICIVLSQQRGPLFAILLIVLAAIIFGAKEKIIKIRYLFIGIAALAFIFLYLSIKNSIVFGWMIERISNPTDAITERYGYQWNHISSSFSPIEYLLGNGIGTFGQFAENVEHGRILDNMYFNLIGELGIFGLSLFIMIVTKSFIISFKSLKKNFVCAALIFAICFAGLGTTLHYYPMITPFLWFSVGILFYKSNNKSNNIVRLENSGRYYLNKMTQSGGVNNL
jgi:hypothetical protein